jgi:cytochrome P450
MPYTSVFLLLWDHQYALFVLACLLFLVAWQILQYVRSPLRHIPGPWLAKITTIPLFIQSFNGDRAKWILEQHHYHGPVIQISPNKVCVASDEGIKAIYSNKAKKSSAYEGFHYRDVKMCIGLQDPKSAHMRRKGMLPAFSQQNLTEMEPVIRLHLERFLAWLNKFDDTGDYIDAFKWFRYLTLDVVTDIAFGQQVGMLVKEDDNFIQQVEYRNKRNSLVRFGFLYTIVVMALIPS